MCGCVSGSREKKPEESDHRDRGVCFRDLVHNPLAVEKVRTGNKLQLRQTLPFLSTHSKTVQIHFSEMFQDFLKM